MCAYREKLAFSVETTRSIGSFSVFNLYIKVFYWMRLFKPTAYFINLITQVVLDIRVFTIMLITMIGAFANFFSIINSNTAASETYAEEVINKPGSEYHGEDREF